MLNLSRSLPLLAAPLLLALSSCGAGLIPLPDIALPDISLTIPAPASETDTRVFYLDENALKDAPDTAKYLSDVRLRGTASYDGTGTLSAVSVYVRSNLDGCTRQLTSNYYTCPVSGEGGNLIGDVEMNKAGTLAGAALTAAVKNRRALIGVKIKAGNVLSGDTIRITGVKVSSRL